jgi:hypothetical protein
MYVKSKFKFTYYWLGVNVVINRKNPHRTVGPIEIGVEE